jgi:hypothetical protein
MGAAIMLSANKVRALRQALPIVIGVVLALALRPDRLQAAVEVPGETARRQIVAQLEAGVESFDNLAPAQRQRMRQNLTEMLAAGLDPTRLTGLFPAPPQPCLPAAEALTAQSAVLDAVQAGLPADLVLSKVQEGCRKHRPPARVAEAAVRMAEALGAAASFLHTASAAGGAGDARQASLINGLTLDLWGGLAPADLARLQDAAAARETSGAVFTLEELAAASHCAANVLTTGAEHEAAVGLAVEVIQRHLTPDEMRELADLVSAAGRKAPVADILTAVTQHLGEGLGPSELVEHMVRAGWLGPGEVPGAVGTGVHAGPGNPGYPGGAGDGTRPGGSRGPGTGAGGGK